MFELIMYTSVQNVTESLIEVFHRFNHYCRLWLY